MRRPTDDNFKYPGAGFGGARGIANLAEMLPGSHINWEAEARGAWRNSAVAICLSYVQDNVPVPMQVVRTAGGKSTPIEGHPLTQLLRLPNPHYAGRTLQAATALSLDVEGVAYWIKRRNSAGRIVRLEWIPHWCMEPGWDDRSDFIGWFNYSPGGSAGMRRIPVEDVVYFRTGIDPENMRKGLSRLKAVLREVVTDNEANTFTASILKNMGVPGAIIMPKPTTAGQVPTTWSQGFKDKLKALWKSMSTGDKRGEAIVVEHGIEITVPGFSPEQLTLDKIRRIPEARIAAALRVPALVVGLSVGENQRTYNNMGQARRIGYEDAVMPLQDLMAETIELQLLPEFSTNVGAEQVVVDRSNVGVLQEARSELYSALGLAVGGPFLTPNEARAELDMPDIDGGEQLGQATPAAAAQAAKIRKEWAEKARARRKAWEALIEEEDGEDDEGEGDPDEDEGE